MAIFNSYVSLPEGSGTQWDTIVSLFKPAIWTRYNDLSATSLEMMIRIGESSQNEHLVFSFERRLPFGKQTVCY